MHKHHTHLDIFRSMDIGLNHAQIDDYNPIDSFGQNHSDQDNGSNHVDTYQYTQMQGLYHWKRLSVSVSLLGFIYIGIYVNSRTNRCVADQILQ